MDKATFEKWLQQQVFDISEKVNEIMRSNLTRLAGDIMFLWPDGDGGEIPAGNGPRPMSRPLPIKSYG
jgi:hypothetical protein